MLPDSEWLETDGLGGFASGTVALARTRRYHALLLCAAGSPARRFVLVNGADVLVRTPEGGCALSRQRYAPGVLGPDGQGPKIEFASEPWPAWTFHLPGGRRIRQEIVVPRDRAATVLTWKLDGDSAGCTLEVRPFLSGRDPHATHHENGVFAFTPERAGDQVRWSPYAGVPPIAIKSNGHYTHDPHWYRNFLYTAESARGLDDTEDLAAPGFFTFDFSAGEAMLILASPDNGAEWDDFTRLPAPLLAPAWREQERIRRAALAGPRHRAVEDFLVRRGAGLTIIAGYPWFTDWGRDTFISLRGLCLATGRLEAARAILLEWAGAVSEGMMPNCFPDGGARPEYNSVDASLWYVIAVHDWLAACHSARRQIPSTDRRTVLAAVQAILTGYTRGTRYGIRADTDGLLFAGAPGVQLTWMDAKVGDQVITPRRGKPVEVQALWINALRFGATFDEAWRAPAARALASFRRKFWNPARLCLYDVVDEDFVPGRTDASLRPNQIFAVGGLPFPLLRGEPAAAIVRLVERQLLTPLGLRTLAPDDPRYCPRYEGGVPARDGAYHQGTAWPWLLGAFVEAWLRVAGNAPAARAEARVRFITPLHRHLHEAGLRHVSEIADGDAPHTPRGCPFQAWSLAEMLRLEHGALRGGLPR
jgi:predicted glycogen debranching enzyme